MADTSVSEEYVGTFQVTTGTGAPVDIEVPSDSSSFYFCDQDMVRLKFPHNFPAIPSNQPAGFEWMIPDQNFAYVYGYTCVGILGFVLLILLNKLRKIVKVFFLSPFEVRRVMITWPLGNFSCPVYFYFYFSQNHLLCSHMSTLQKHHKSISLSKFSSLPNPTAYVPEVKTPFDPFPILLCDVRSMNLELIEWEDPEDMSYRSHTVTTDIPGIESRKIFSSVHHWSPPK